MIYIKSKPFFNDFMLKLNKKGHGYANQPTVAQKQPKCKGLWRFFNVTKTGVYPSGAYYDEWVSQTDCNTSDRGESCAAKILKENAVNY